MGDINVFIGPMKCGKTQHILNEYKRQLIAGKKVKMFKPSIDTRCASNIVLSRNGIDIPAVSINKISDLEKYEADVYCIDEFQFLKGNVKTIERMADDGKKFFIAGLNLTAERKPFGKMDDLLCIADNILLFVKIVKMIMQFTHITKEAKILIFLLVIKNMLPYVENAIIY